MGDNMDKLTEIIAALRLLELDGDKIFEQICHDVERGCFTDARKHLNFVDELLKCAKPSPEDCPPLTDEEMARLIVAFESPMKPVALSAEAIDFKTGLSAARLYRLGVITPSQKWAGCYILTEALK